MTIPTKELLATLNAYRERVGLKALKAWKESRAKLEAAVAAIPEHMTDEQADASVAAEEKAFLATREPTRLDYEAANDGVIPIHDLTPGATVEGDANAKTWDKAEGGPVKTKKPKAEKKAAPDTTGTRTIPELCRALGKKEKVGRAKCRRWGSKLRPLMIDPTKWRFKIENLAAVCTILGWEAPSDWK